MRWRRWPGCTTSKTPWQRIAFFARGRLPRIAASSSTVLTLCPYCCVREDITASPDRGGLCISAEEFEPGCRRLCDRFGVPQRRVAPIIDVVEDAAHALLEGDFRLPAQLAADLGNIGEGA